MGQECSTSELGRHRYRDTHTASSSTTCREGEAVRRGLEKEVREVDLEKTPQRRRVMLDKLLPGVWRLTIDSPDSNWAKTNGASNSKGSLQGRDARVRGSAGRLA